ncbi:Thioredoxin [uncultured archaeon]|nr:Thioredoxin [uncultured archaeon]
MVLCIVALPVFAILSLFSAKYRSLARRAFDCVVRRVTLRPCETGLDEELKASALAGIMRLSPAAAGFVSRNFQAFSFLFTLLFIASIVFTAQGIYNFVVYGNCNGPEGGFCIYNGLQNPAFLKAPSTLQGIRAGNQSSNLTVIEFGCYVCPYTKASEDIVQGMLEKYGSRVQFVFKPFPTKHPYSLEAAVAAACAGEGGKYWEYRAALFANQSYYIENGDAAFKATAARLGIEGFGACYDSKRLLSQIEATVKEGEDCGIYGTPTFFVGGKPFVGPSAAQDANAEVARLLGGA